MMRPLSENVTIFCFHCQTKLTTVRDGDARDEAARKDGLPCPKCGTTVKALSRSRGPA